MLTQLKQQENVDDFKNTEFIKFILPQCLTEHGALSLHDIYHGITFYKINKSAIPFWLKAVKRVLYKKKLRVNTVTEIIDAILKCIGDALMQK